MNLKFLSSIDLPEHLAPGGFDHAAFHRINRSLYVAHTANHTLDVIDCVNGKYMHSIPGLTGIAGALVSDEHNLVFTSNRGENTIGIFTPGDEDGLVKVPVGVRPNGLSFDSEHNLLLVANVGDPAIANSFTLSMVNVAERRMFASILMPGRTRWTIYDPASQAFYVNIADPAQIVVVTSSDPTHIQRIFYIPSAGPHGLDLDPAEARLFCACDAGQLITVDILTGKMGQPQALSGVPDVIFFNADRHHLYVAVGDPGVIDIFDTTTMQRVGTIPTEKGAHTIGFNPDGNQIYALLPLSHRVQVYEDER